MKPLSLIVTLSGILSGVVNRTKAFFGQVAENTTSKSLVGRAAAARVEPITIIDSDLANNERLEDTLNVTVNLFASIYIQAIALTSTTVSGAQIIKTLDKINPAKAGEDVAYSLESIDGVENSILKEDLSNQVKDVGDVLSFESNGKNYTANRDKAKKATIKVGADVKETLRDIPELSVGKLMTVTLKAEGEEFQIPVSIRLAVSQAQKSSLVKALQHRFSGEESALERSVKWKTGAITSIVDLITCADLVRSHYKNLVADKDGIYTKLTPNKSSTLANAAWTGETTVAQASSVLIISKDTAIRVEAHTGGKFENMLFRQRILKATGVMILGIVDPLHDEVTFYLESLQQGQTLQGRSISKMGKGDGPDVNEILKALVTGQSGFLR